MDRISIFFDDSCPALYIVKSALFIFVTIAVLYLPLGDPDVDCERRRVAARCNNSPYVCCLCNIYQLMIKTTNALIDILEMMMCLMMKVLYEAKLKFYTMLEAVDRYDLCRTVSCGKNGNEQTTDTSDVRHRQSCSSKNKLPD